MKTLYVSDLDGTLLRSDALTSDYTNDTVNALVNKGMLFSYATARSFVTAKKVTSGLSAKIPVIVYNGAFVIDNGTGERMISHYIGENANDLLRDLLYSEIYPIVYAVVDGVERFSYRADKCSTGMRTFIDSRRGDPRDNPVKDTAELFKGDIFYVTCIDDPKKLEPVYHRYKHLFHAVYQCDVYTGDQWLEFMSKSASKSNAIGQLKEMLNCERIVVFGDGKNDIDMFQLADESYAVSNAVDELKKMATGVIGSNDDDGVAKWLYADYKRAER